MVNNNTLCMINNNTSVPPGLMLMDILPYVNSYSIIINILIHNKVHLLANVVIIKNNLNDNVHAYHHIFFHFFLFLYF